MRFLRPVAFVAISCFCAALRLSAQTTLYWDTGGPSGTGSWVSDPYWNTESSGGVETRGEWLDGSIAVFVVGGSSATSGTVTVDQAVSFYGLTFSSGGTFTISGSSTFTLGAGNILLTPSSSAIISAVISGSNGLTKIGAGSLTLSAANTYAGTTTVQAGAITATNSAAFSSGSVSVATGASVSLQAAGTFANNFSLASGATLTSAPTNTQSLSGVISGQGAFVKTGSTQTTLSGANTFAGGVTVNGGTLVATNTSALSSGTVTFNSGTVRLSTSGTYANNFVLADSTFLSSVGIGINAVISGTVALTSGTATLGTLNNSTLTLQNVVSGSGQLLKASPGTLILSGANTYSGGTLINAGTVRLSGSGTLGNTSGALTLNSDSAVLDLNGTSQTVGLFSNSGYYSAAVRNNANGTTSTLTVGQGNATGATFYGTLIDNSNSGTGQVALVKTGTGSLTLYGDSTHSGGTTLNAGTLTLGSATALANATGTLTVAGGTFATAQASTNVGGDVSLSGGDFSLNGTSVGLLTLAAGKTFTLSGGTLNFTLGSTFDQIVSAGAGTLVLSGGTLAFDTTAVGFSYASAYQVFSGFGSTSFSSLSLTGYDTTNYTAAISNTGALSFAAAAAPIPEPSTYAALAGGVALALAAWKRRRRALG